MPNIKISQLPSASQLVDNDIVQVIQSGTNKKMTMTQIKEYVGSSIGQDRFSEVTPVVENGVPRLKLTFDKPLTLEGDAIFNSQPFFRAGIAIRDKKIIGVATPEADTDAANKGYVDGTVATKQDKFANVASDGYNTQLRINNPQLTIISNGLNLSGRLNMQTDTVRRKIINVGDPTDDHDAATKKYVDDNVAEKSFELIENYTMPETAVFSRQYEPDSTPYNFKALLVYITNNTESNLVVSLNLNTEGVAYTSIAAGGISPCLFIVYGKRLIPISLTTAVRDSGARNPYSPRQRAIGMAVNSITSISTAGTLPTGTNISIYGVRA